MRDVLADYLGELRTALRTSGRRRRRIVAEVADHLADLVDAERERGLGRAAAVARAVERFGAPAELAAEFNADAARRSLDRASRALAGVAAVAFVAAGLSLQPGVAARPWPSAQVFSLVMELWLQVPVTCGALALFLIVVAPRLRAAPLSGRPAELAGRSLAIASVLFLPVAVVAAGNLGATMPLGERLPLAIVVLGVPVAAACAVRTAARARWLADPADAEDVLDVIAAVGEALAGRWSVARRAHRSAGRAWRAARVHAPRTTRWVDLRHHPWRAAATTSVAAGLGLTAPDLLRGDPDLLAAGVEAVAVYVVFAALGGPLGLRGRRPQEPVSPVEVAATT